MAVLDIQDLGVSFEDRDGNVLSAVRHVSLALEQGSITCLVGESGCGKSLTAKSCLNLLPYGARASGAIVFRGENMLCVPDRSMRAIRGRRISMIFQESMTSLNPVLTIGRQIAEPLVTHLGLSRSKAMERVVELLGLVGVPAPQTRLNVWPHELSGGLRQRIMIAMALACGPDVLLADEPTTALDPTIQGQILHLIREESRSRGMAVLFITHDLGVVAQIADNVGVMYAGNLVEYGSTADVLTHPRHPYTKGLLDSAPSRTSITLDRLPSIPGTVPPLGSIPEGCAFQDRCPSAEAICARPFERETVQGAHRVLCRKPL